MSTEHLQMKLDARTVEQNTQLCPDAVKEPIQWAAAFCREKCNRQVSILQQMAKHLGFATDYSYWHKIFTGKYFVPDKAGKMIGSVQNFLQIIDGLRKEERLAWRAGKMPFIETPTWLRISSFIDKKRMPQRVNKFGGIAGPTGAQKSACFKEYAARNNHGRVVHVESPERPRIAQFISDLAARYGVHGGGMDRKTSGIIAAVNETKTVIVDNVQRLYKPAQEGDQPIFNFLQKLQDDTGCTVIMSYTPDFVRILQAGQSRGYFEQFIGRMGGINRMLILDDFTPREDILAIANAYGLKDAEKHLAYLETIVREPGRIRCLFEDLQEAKQEAGESPLTIAHIKSVRGEEEA